MTYQNEAYPRIFKIGRDQQNRDWGRVWRDSESHGWATSVRKEGEELVDQVKRQGGTCWTEDMPTVAFKPTIRQTLPSTHHLPTFSIFTF